MDTSSANSSAKLDTTRSTIPTDNALPAHTLVEPLVVADLLTDTEREVMRMHVNAKLSPSEISNALNAHTSSKRAYSPSKILKIIKRIDAKLERVGEHEHAKPNALHAQELRERFDSILRVLRSDLAETSGSVATYALRARLGKNIADIERTRDDCLRAFGIGNNPLGINAENAYVYVSHLVEPARKHARVDSGAPNPPAEGGGPSVNIPTHVPKNSDSSSVPKLVHKKSKGPPTDSVGRPYIPIKKPEVKREEGRPDL